ncbi:MAG TPA: VOC family protein [Reyranella sp.]|nr:VOC family protein [Reyranella sp.]
MSRFTPWAYVLAVQDLDASAAWFRDVLGFRIDWTDGQDWRLAQRGDVRLMIGHCPDDKRAAEIGSHSWFGYVEVDDVDALHSELTGRGATCTPPRDQPYGMREIVVTSPEGHRIVFAHDKAKR